MIDSWAIAKTVAAFVSPLLAMLGFATLWGKHSRSVEHNTAQLEQYKADQLRASQDFQSKHYKEHEVIWGKIEKLDTNVATTVKEIYERIREEDRRRDGREDKVREDMSKMVSSFERKVETSNKLMSDLIVAVGKRAK